MKHPAIRHIWRSFPGVTVALACLAASPAAAQIVDFEGGVPTGWSYKETPAGPNLLATSAKRFKSGASSLHWEWSGGGVITITDPGISAANVGNKDNNTCSFWIWNGEALPEKKLLVQFMADEIVEYSFEVGLDFTGWRRVLRRFNSDEMTVAASRSNSFTEVRITAPAQGNGSLFIDAINWTSGNVHERVRDAQNLPVVKDDARTYFIHAYNQLPTDAAPEATFEEKQELKTLRERWLSSVKDQLSENPEITEARDEFNKLGIVKNADGGTRGLVLTNNLSLFNGWSLSLAAAYRRASPDAQESRVMMNDIVAHLLDQGIAANSNLVPTASPTPAYNFRDLPTALIAMAADVSGDPTFPNQPSAFDETTKARLWDLLCWAYGTGDHWHTDWDRNMDDMHLHSFQQLGAILFLTSDDNEAVRQLKGHQAYLDRFLSPSPGSEGGIKIDGTGFHHNAHYNEYMYAYRRMATVTHLLRGTGFQMSQAAYEHLRLAFLTLMNMSADAPSTDNKTIGYFSNALSGRKPFDIDLEIYRIDLRNLAEAGGPFYGEAADPILAQAYNRRFGSISPHEPFAIYPSGTAPVGFFQYNYSPLGIYRRDSWVASIRAPNRFSWTSEIWTNSNVYGRYQAYGALDILYHGQVTSRTPKNNGGTDVMVGDKKKVVTVRSGYSIDGWDWSHPPGTTTIALPHNQLGSPIREDVRSNLRFSGALASREGKSGLYAARFQERDRYGGKKLPFHNTTFVWRKSWFLFDKQIICLGSDIANNDTVNRTVTTLFQGVLPTRATPITVNNESKEEFPYSPEGVLGGGPNWLIDAYGTGFIVQPQANNTLKIRRSNQESAHHTASGAQTTDDFAKAWIDHGTNPGHSTSLGQDAKSAAGYEYTVLPATDAVAMAAAAAKHADPATKPYTVLQRDAAAHVVKWNATGEIGYSFFSADTLPAAVQNAGLLLAVSHPCLVMARLEANGTASISLVDPDLDFINPATNASVAEGDYGTPNHGITRIHYGTTAVSRANTRTFTVRGTCSLENPSDGTSIVQTTEATPTTPATTTVQVITQHGLAQHVTLVAPPWDGLSSWVNLGADWEDPANWGANWGATPPANTPDIAIATFGVTTVQPVLDGAFAVKGLSLAGGTTLSGGGNLTLGSAGIVANGSGNALSLAGLTLHEAQTWAVLDAELSISSVIAGAVGAHLIKSGPGTLTLSGANSHAGITVVNAGVLNMHSDQSAADGGWNIQTPDDTSAPTATVNFEAGSVVKIGAQKKIQIGAATNTGRHPASTLNSHGEVINQGALQLERNSNLNLYENARWTQSGGLTVTGRGGSSAGLTVHAGAEMLYSGSTTVKINRAANSSGNGVLTIDGSGRFTTSAGFENGVSSVGGTGSARIILTNGGTLRLSAAVPALTNRVNLHLGAGGGVIDTDGFNATLNGVVTGGYGLNVTGITGVGGLTVKGPGTLTLTGENTYTGATAVAQGHLELASTGHLRFRPEPGGAGTRLTVAPGATASFLGAFALDLTASGHAFGDSWPLIAAPAQAATYGSGFHVVGFTGTGEAGARTWTRLEDARTWVFHEATGRLHLHSAAYAAWLDAQAALADSAPDADPDGDGVPNLLEYILGGDPASGRSRHLLPSLAVVPEAPETLQFSFTRNPASVADTYLFLDYSFDLVTWHQLEIGEEAGESDVHDVSYTVGGTGDDADLITVTLPRGTTARLFARLRVNFIP